MQFLSFLSDPYYYSLCLYILGTVSLPIHIFGAYCILFQTPAVMNRVKWVMFNLHFWSCSLDISLGILGQPFMIPPIFGGIPMGLLHHFGVNTGVMVYLMVIVLELVSFSCASIFENRFFILFAEDSWWRIGRYPWYLANILMSILYFVPTMMGVPDQNLASEWVFKNHPEYRRYDDSTHPIYVIAYDPEAQKYINYRMAINSAILFPELCFFFFLLRWNMNKAGKNMTMSPKTFEAHTAFMKAINMQIAIPFLVISFPQGCMMGLGFLDIRSLEMNSLAYMATSIHGSLATLIMLYWHVPYNQYCSKLFCRKSERSSVSQKPNASNT
ncbi:hypothetical protein CAEBREN_17446 [Caenorhabditis brenneri]|uniref:Uncharacterized protein n=1 Tax=Caenorhabditis brenneri TaxID=135651 RepID=G0PIM9_CAEBE|nr:hypothetical protein CAEBREN_17446 [Caenorhabditis brenneri]